jgi:hypothetical protein
MLQTVSTQINSHLRYYTGFDALEKQANKWEDLIIKTNYEIVLEKEDCDQIISLLLQVQDIVKFFKAHLLDYKKADVYLRRYENLRERVLTLVNNLAVKTIKEAL